MFTNMMQLHKCWDIIDAIAVALDLNANILFINAETCNVLGYDYDELIGANWFNLVSPPELKEEYWNIFYQIIAGNIEPYKMMAEQEMLTKNAERRYVDWRNSALLGDDGKIIGMFSSGRDVTDKKIMEMQLQLTRQWYELLFNSINDAVYVHGYKSDRYANKFIDVNAVACNTLGYEKDDLLNMTPDDIKEEETEEERAAIDAKIRKTGAAIFESVHVTKDNKKIPVEVSSRAITFYELPAVLSIARDITERKNAERCIKESEEKFREVVENLREVLWLRDLEREKIIYVNPAFELVWGHSCEDLYDDPLLFVTTVHPEDRPKVVEGFFNSRFDGDDFLEEYRIVRPDETISWIRARTIVIRNEKGTPVRVVGIAEDITEAKAMEDRLRALATTDSLTGLNNRYSFFNKANREFDRHRRSNQPLSVLMFDIDFFKNINDAYGHAVGDVVLQDLSVICSASLRGIDIIGRLGGEEFAVILIETGLDGAKLVAERLRSQVENMLVETNNFEIQFTISIGGVVVSDGDFSLEEALKRADAALYRAKANGRNRVEFD